jgi:hypothetical protein
MPLLYWRIEAKYKKLEVLASLISQYPERGRWIRHLSLRRDLATEKNLEDILGIFHNAHALAHLELCGCWLQSTELDALRQLPVHQLESFRFTHIRYNFSGDLPATGNSSSSLAAAFGVLFAFCRLSRLEIQMRWVKADDLRLGNDIDALPTSTPFLRTLVIECGGHEMTIFKHLKRIRLLALEEFHLDSHFLKGYGSDPNGTFRHLRDFLLAHRHIRKVQLGLFTPFFEKLFEDPHLISATELALCDFSWCPIYHISFPRSIQSLIVQGSPLDEQIQKIFDGILNDTPSSLKTICFCDFEWSEFQVWNGETGDKLRSYLLRFEMKGVDIVDNHYCSLNCGVA